MKLQVTYAIVHLFIINSQIVFIIFDLAAAAELWGFAIEHYSKPRMKDSQRFAEQQMNSNCTRFPFSTFLWAYLTADTIHLGIEQIPESADEHQHLT